MHAPSLLLRSNPRIVRFLLAVEREAKKEEQRLKLEEDKRKRDEAASVDPATMFKTAEWSAWDESGLPTKDAKGEEITKSKSKTLKKAWDRQKKTYDAWVAAKK